MGRGRSALSITTTPAADACVLTVGGILDDTTYRPLHDAIVKAALDEPAAVITDISRLAIREEPALAVFTSARWRVADWPDIPMGLVCAHRHGQSALRRNGITRYVPVYATVESAVTDLVAQGARRYRRRASADLPAHESSIARCREMVNHWLTGWSRTDFCHAASTVAAILVEDVLADTDTKFAIRLETDGSTVAVAVQYVSTALTMGHQPVEGAGSRRDVLAAASRASGSYTNGFRRTAWAAIGPENRF
ncbi:hypothetical protein BST20_12155 [Mycobacterium branderi]|uniref:STAS domain-containing protein n=1 Tax=Mycobacterium branderi TaxID=43348 RepID=A0AA91LY01_9MYCO|nr:hypothetical protein BST20_12155 [Mycobacterium branderi]